MSKVKKIILLSLASITIALFFSCTKKDQGKKIEITLASTWDSPETGKLFAKIARRYMEIHPEVTISVMTQVKPDKLLTMFAGGTGVDIINIHYTFLKEFADRDVLEPLDPWISKTGTSLSDYYQVGLDTFTVNSKLYGIPYKGSVRSILYNKAIFDKVGVAYPKDMNFEDMRDIAKKLTVHSDNPNERRIGYNLQYNFLDLVSFIWSDGGDWLSADGTKSTFNTPVTARSLQRVLDLRLIDKVTGLAGDSAVESGDVAENFGTGKIAMVDGGPWLVPSFRNMKNLEWDAALFPKGEKGRQIRYAGMAYGIWSGSKNKEVAWDFLKYLSDEKSGARQMAQLGIDMPPRKSLAESTLFNSPVTPWNEDVFIQGLQYARPLQLVNNQLQVFTIFNQEIMKILLGEKSMVDTLPELDKQINSIITR